MTYNQFLNYVKEQSVYELEHPEDYQATINHVIKNNSVELDGICLHKHGESLSPTVYLNNFYEQYQDGRPLKSILNEIISILSQDIPKLEISDTLLDDYDAIHPSIILRIVNYEKNSHLLENCPYLPFCDLAITFRWLVHQDASGIASALITNRELERWNVSIDELYQAAIKNTMRMFPSSIRLMQDVLSEYLSNNVAYPSITSLPEPDFQVYVLTNTSHINGSTCVVYEHLLHDFSKQIGSDLYILPSSIHEVLLVPTKYDLQENDLLALVQHANQTVVEITDYLSDSIYRYDSKQNRILMIS